MQCLRQKGLTSADCSLTKAAPARDSLSVNCQLCKKRVDNLYYFDTMMTAAAVVGADIVQ